MKTEYSSRKVAKALRRVEDSTLPLSLRLGVFARFNFDPFANSERMATMFRFTDGLKAAATNNLRTQ